MLPNSNSKVTPCMVPNSIFSSCDPGDKSYGNFIGAHLVMALVFINGSYNSFENLSPSLGTLTTDPSSQLHLKEMKHFSNWHL